MSYNLWIPLMGGWCQLIFCLIMLLILARLSSEMRCVTAAAKMFSTETASLAAVGACLLSCVNERRFCAVPRLHCLVYNRQ